MELRHHIRPGGLVFITAVLSAIHNIHTVMAEHDIRQVHSAQGNKTAFDFGDEDEVEQGWRNNLLIVMSLALVIGAAVAMVYCCCRSCSDGAPGTVGGQAPGTDPTGQPGLTRSGTGRYPRDSFYAPPPRYSAIVRSQSQRRVRLNALERAAVSSLPRYTEAVQQLEEQEKEQEQEEITDTMRPREDQVDTAVELTETLLTVSVSTGNLTTATLVDETLASSGSRPLFHSADSLLAAETAVALENEIDSPIGPQMAARSASCSNLLDMDAPEPYHVLLRKKVIMMRPDSLPPRYSEILEKSQPKSKAMSPEVNSTDV